MSFCKVCLGKDCTIEHTPEEIEKSNKKAEELRQALRTLVEYAKKLEE